MHVATRTNAMMRRTHNWTGWSACAKAGCVYACGVFAIGFVLGAIRVLLLAPRVGNVVAVSLEAPLMLAISWKMSRWSAGKHGLLIDTRKALLMGAIAFAVLMSMEFCTAILCFNRTVGEYFSSFLSAPGAIGFAAQLCFAGFPFLQASGNRLASS
jgi:hypothetical protein